MAKIHINTSRNGSFSSIEKEEEYDVLGHISAGAQAPAKQREPENSHAIEASEAAMLCRAPCMGDEKKSTTLVDERYATGLQDETNQNRGGDAAAADALCFTDSCNPKMPAYTKGYLYHLSALLGLFFCANLRTEPVVSPGKTRVRWTCTCGEDLYDDFTEVIAGSLIDLQERLRNDAQTGSSAQVSGTATRAARSWQEYINTIDTFFNHIAAQIQSFITLPGRLPLRGESGQAAQVRQPPLPSSTEDPQILLLCVNLGSNGTWLHQELLENVHDDTTFFQFLRSQSSKHRSRLSWFSLRGVSTISLTRFRVDASNFAEIHHHAVICSKKCSCLPSVERVQANEYRCYPAPEINPGYFPPIGTRALTHYFKKPHTFKTTQRTIFNQVPKRAQSVLSVGADERQLVWGIHIAEGWHWRWIYFIMVVSLLIGAFVFVVAWSVSEGDIQSAFVIAGSWMAMAPVYIGYIAVRDVHH